MRLTPDPARPGILLGYVNLSDKVVDEAVALLADVLAQAGLPSVA